MERRKRGVTFSGNVGLTTRTLTVDGANNTAISGAITSTGLGNGLTKSGNGTLNLGGASANTFNGPVIINNGTLAANKAGALDSVASITINGGTLSLGGAGNRVNNAAPIALAGGKNAGNSLSETFWGVDRLR